MNHHNSRSRRSSSSARDTLKALLSPAAMKPFGILVLYFMMYQFSGVNTITFYAVEIFQSTGTSLNKNACTILLGCVRLIFTVAASIAMRRMGRRALTFVSGFGCGFSMIGLGVYMLLKYQWDHADPPVEPVATWIPVFCIFTFTITCTIGFLVVPWVMIGELYPQNVRGLLGGMTTCMAHTFVFIVVKTYPFMSLYLHQHGTFIVYGCVSFLGEFYFIFLCMSFFLCVLDIELVRFCMYLHNHRHGLLLLLSAGNEGQNPARHRGLFLGSDEIADDQRPKQQSRSDR